MVKESIEVFLEMITKVPSINEARVTEIHAKMAEFRTEDIPNDLWVRKCLYEIPQTDSEYLLVAFVLGTTGGMEAAEKKERVN